MKRGIERVHRWNEVYDVFEVALGRSNALNKEGCAALLRNLFQQSNLAIGPHCGPSGPHAPAAQFTRPLENVEKTMQLKARRFIWLIS